jgi:CheY-like chemotaxis protein
MTSLGRAIVLVIDADPLSLTATSAVLHCADYEVHCAASREAALKAARDLELDLVVCDLDIGGIEGYAILDEIRQIPQRGDVSVMFSSACQQPEVIRKSHAQGATYHLRKPFDPQVLLELADKALWMPHLVRTKIRQPHFQIAPIVPTPNSTV